jgi:cytoskeletal protein RodZ
MKKTAIIFLLVVVGLYFWFSKNHKAPEVAEPVVEQTKTTPEAPPASSATAPAAPKVTVQTKPAKAPSAATTAGEKSIDADSMKIVYAPDTDIRNEVAQNPEQTPKSLIAFSVNLGKQIDVALKSKSEATKLSQNLVQCAAGDGESKNHSVEALCLSGAKELSQKFPELLDNYKKAVSLADPSVAKMASFLGK